MIEWLLADDALAEVRALERSGVRPTPEQLEAYAHAAPSAAAQTTVAAGVATIAVTGVLTPRRSALASFFGGGGTTYSEIREAIATADAAADVSSILLEVDSPGGTVDGLFDTLDVIAAIKKPITARATRAQSAAYAIAAATGRIEATGKAAQFGSIGVAVTHMVWSDEVDITSTEAPDKRPDVTTEAGKAVVRRHLDAIHELFVEAIADGRNTTAAAVNANYGRGATLLARQARSAGMIDSITGRSAGASTAASAASTAPAAGDIGDQVVAIMEARRGGTSTPASPPQPTETPAPGGIPPANNAPYGAAGRPPNADHGDQVVCVMEHRAAGLPVPAWAREHIPAAVTTRPTPRPDPTAEDDGPEMAEARRLTAQMNDFHTRKRAMQRTQR